VSKHADFFRHLDASLPWVGLERQAIEHFTRALDRAADAVPRSAAGCVGKQSSRNGNPGHLEGDVAVQIKADFKYGYGHSKAWLGLDFSVRPRLNHCVLCLRRCSKRCGLERVERDPRLGISTSWSGLLIRPIFALPFALLALYRPLTVLIEASINVARFTDRLTYLTPLLAGSLISVLGLTLEIKGEVPWTIQLNVPTCEQVQQTGSKLFDYPELPLIQNEISNLGQGTTP
jgi:hypothetical protein